MHPEVARVLVDRENDVEGDIGLTSFSLYVPSVGFGQLFVRQTGESIVLIDMFAAPRHNGIGTRLLRQALLDFAPISVHGASVDDETRNLLAPYIKRAHLGEGPVHIPSRVFPVLPIVSFLEAAGIHTISIQCVYEREKYSYNSDSIYISGIPISRSE